MKESNMVKEKKRWPLALLIVAAVVIISVVLIVTYRDAPGQVPIQTGSDGSGNTIVTWQNENGVYAQCISPLL